MFSLLAHLSLAYILTIIDIKMKINVFTIFYNRCVFKPATFLTLEFLHLKKQKSLKIYLIKSFC